MINGKKLIIVMPARNNALTLKQTYDDLPHDIIDEIILVDNNSQDKTIEIAQSLDFHIFANKVDEGYGGSQKRLYTLALEKNADIIAMVHPDYQYDATRLKALIQPIIEGRQDIMFGSRMSTKQGALAGGMPYIKFILNKIFCVLENISLGVRFTEHFSGFRAYDRKVLEKLSFEKFSSDYIFDQHLMIASIAMGFRIGEIPIPTRYFSKASSINALKGSKFLLEILHTLVLFWLFKSKLYTSRIFTWKS